MEEYFNGLLKEVDQRMATTAPGMDGKEVIGVCREMVSYLKGKNRELKEYALAHPFAGDAKEILYFKYYKPALTAAPPACVSPNRTTARRWSVPSG